MNDEQTQRLEEFKLQFGDTWRHQLTNIWLTGDDMRQPQGHLLRQIRDLVYQGKIEL